MSFLDALYDTAIIVFCLIAFRILYPVFHTETEQERILRAQQKSLKRHHKKQIQEAKRLAKIQRRANVA